MQTSIRFILNTDVLIDYPNIIPLLDSINTPSMNPTVDLSNAHVIIPTTAIRELSSFKKENSDRGKASREVLGRLRALFNGKSSSLDENYYLDPRASVSIGNTVFSIMPVHHEFGKSLPFNPSSEDMDGQTILTALAVICLEKNLPVDGGLVFGKLNSTLEAPNVILLTNDNGLAVRANGHGVKTMRYSYEYPAPYTGRREVDVPNELFAEFYCARTLAGDMWRDAMKNEPKLITNEFIVLRPQNIFNGPPKNNAAYFDYVGRYDPEKDAIVPLRYIRNFPVTIDNIGQAIYAEALVDPNISAVICTGPAGSGKTYMSTIYGYEACKDGLFIGVTVVPCESHGNIGALPGDLNDKMDPEVQSFKNALRNYILISNPKMAKQLDLIHRYGACCKNTKNGASDNDKTEKRSLRATLYDTSDQIWDNWFINVPICNARGRDFSNEFVLFDEFQDQTVQQADMLIKRLGGNGKIVITGDINQIHAPYLDRMNNGLVYASAQLFDHPMVAQVCFTEDEVVRHPLVKEIAYRQKYGIR